MTLITRWGGHSSTHSKPGMKGYAAAHGAVMSKPIPLRDETEIIALRTVLAGYVRDIEYAHDRVEASVALILSRSSPDGTRRLALREVLIEYEVMLRLHGLPDHVIEWMLAT